MPTREASSTGRAFRSSIQLYSLGDEPQKDLEGRSKVAAIGFRDIELPGLLGREPADVRRAADDAGVAISSVHIGTTGDLSVRTDPQRLAEHPRRARRAPGRRADVSNAEGFQAPAGRESRGRLRARGRRKPARTMWTDLAALLNERAALLKPHGIALGYHNHSVEFMQVGTRTAWEILAAETDPALVHFEADVGWIASAGVDPIDFFKRYHGRVRQLHVKDVKAGLVPNTAMRTDPTEVGSGTVDWARVLPAAWAAGARHFYYEQEPPFAIPRLESNRQILCLSRATSRLKI